MKKVLLTATLVLLVLAALSGLGAAQEKKAKDKPKAGETTLATPPADTVTLSATPNQASTKGCRVNAKPGLTNAAFIYPDYHYVNFEKFVNNHWAPLFVSPNSNSMVTNSQGVAPLTVPWNTKIRAWITKVSPNHEKVFSNEFSCGKQPWVPNS